MLQLHKELDANELKVFAQALQDLDNRFPEFCERVLQLYGPERKQMLAGERRVVLEVRGKCFFNK